MGRLKILTGKQAAKNMGRILKELKDGPVFVADENKRVTAVMMDISDYFDLVDELDDMVDLIRAVGRGDCCSGEEEECCCGSGLLDEAFGENSD